MARKRRQRKKSPVLEYRRLSTDELRRRIRESVDRGNTRAAIDMAKECYRQDATPAHAELLARVYHRRACQLLEKNLCTEAMVVIGHALSLGAGDADILRVAFECGVRSDDYPAAVRVLEQMRDPADRARARRLLADRLVTCGEHADGFCDPALLEEATRIRKAFAAYERGDDKAAAAELKTIGLQSPCASWKWLLRGLTARAHGDLRNMQASWKRIMDDGQAGKLARLLVSEPGVPDESGKTRPAAVHAERADALGHSRAHLLAQIQRALHDRADRTALRVCGRLLAAVEPEARESYAQRLGRAVCTSLQWIPSTAREFRRLFGTLPEDPRFARLLALEVEEEDQEEAPYVWYDYLEDLPAAKAIPSHLQARARALVWARMGKVMVEEACGERTEYDFAFPGERPRRIDAATCYRESIRHWPDDVQTHEKLLAVLFCYREFKRAERHAEQMLARWPAHIEALLFLGTRCFQRDAVRKALSYFDRARAAEPFNATIRGRMRECLLRSAQRRLEKNNPGLARKDFEQAESLCDPGVSAADLYCKWAALEWRAANPEKAEALFAKAQASGGDFLPACYQMAIELGRADASAGVQQRIEKRLAEAWRTDPSGASAAAVAALAQDALKAPYPRREDHQRAVIRYLRRARKAATFSEDQWLAICRSLEALEDWTLLASYAEQAGKLHPDNYFFALFIGRSYLKQCKRLTFRLRKRLSRAASQAIGAHDIRAANELEMLGLGIPPGSFGPGGIPSWVCAAVDEEYDDDDDDEDYDDDDVDPPPRRKRRRRRPDPNQMTLFDDLFGAAEEAS